MNKLLKNIGIEPAKIYANAELLKTDIFNDNRKLSGIYRWTNEETGDCYVGSANDLTKRLRSYFQPVELEKSPRHINRALLKYGHDKFKLEILEYCEKDKIVEREQFYLDELNPVYNILKTAYSMEGFKHNAETLEFLREREFSQEHKDNLSKAGTGRIFSEETLNKLSESLAKHRKDHPLTPEALENIRQKTTEREGVPVALVNQEDGSVMEFTTQTEAGTFLGMTRQAIKRAFDRNSIIGKLYKVERLNKEGESSINSTSNSDNSSDDGE